MKRIIKTIFVVGLILLASGSIAQMLSPKWETCLGGTAWDEGYGIIYADSTYWAIATTRSNDGDISFNHGDIDIWLLHIDINGNLINEKNFGGTKGEYDFLDIKKLNDSVFYIGGNTNSIDGDVKSNRWPSSLGNIWIIKINNKGEIIWEKVVGNLIGTVLRDITITNDGGVVALGLTEGKGGDVTEFYGFDDLWMIKLNSTGQKLWDMSLGGIGIETGGSVIQTSDGGYMVVGTTDGYGGGNYDSTCNHHNPGSGFSDAWVVKLDSARNIQWQQCYGGTYIDGAYNIMELEDGYIVLGYTQSNDGDVSGLHGPAGPNSIYGGDIWVFKIDFQGNLLWQRCLGGTYDDFARNIFTTSDGGFMIVGNTASKDGDVVGNHDLLAGYTNDVWFAKIDSVGNLLWQYCYGAPLTEYMYRGVVQKSDWDYVVAIGTHSTEWWCHNPDREDVRLAEIKDCSGEPPLPAPDTIFGPEMFCNSVDSIAHYSTVALPEAYSYKWLIVPPDAGAVVSTDSTNAEISWSKYYTGSVALFVKGDNNCNTFKWSPLKTVNIYNCTGIAEHNQNGFRIAVYPNPATSLVQFEIKTNGESNNGFIYIFNLFGQKIADLPLMQNVALWHTKNLPRGIYFYRYTQAANSVAGRVLLK